MIRVPLPYCVDALALFERLRDLPQPVLLHSGDRTSAAGRYDVMAADPIRPVVYQDGELRVGCASTRTEAPFDALPLYFGPNGDRPAEHFRTGFIGYFGYGLQHTLERLPDGPIDVAGLPLICGGDYGWSVVTDHLARTTELWHDANVATPDVQAIVRRLARDPAGPIANFSIGTRFSASMSDREYADAFDSIKTYLIAGDCYQVNLARHYTTSLRGDRHNASWAAYRRLVGLQPAPFEAYLATPYGDVVSLSPERFVRKVGARIETSPIKGTAPRHRDTKRDHASLERLRCSEKDRAENLMIVDLLRNDLGRICRPGSVRVDDLFRVQSFANVHHLVSTIRGETVAGIDAWNMLKAVFPGGSITGAPKIRAMEIINQLEPVARSVYCGSIGWVDRSGSLDTNIAIRTLAFTTSGVHAWGGGGIVADSIAATEMSEIEHKIGRLLQATAGLSASSCCSPS